jgi:polyhydroxybutyrate depolymerase
MRVLRSVILALLLVVVVGGSDAALGPALLTSGGAKSSPCPGVRLDPDGEKEPAQAHPTGTTWRTLRVGGVLRSYLLSVPPSLRDPAPLLVAFHGLREWAGCFGATTKLVSATQAAGLVLVLPESSGPAFNDGRLGSTGPDDDAFALALIHSLVSTHLADPQRVVLTGFSNGAGMAMEVAAAHPALVAAFVSIDGSLIDAPDAPRPTGPVPAYLVHGTADRVQPWQGRRSAGPLWPAYIPVEETVAQWVDVDGGGAPVVTPLPATQGAREVTVSTWSTSGAGQGVTFYAVNGMGHVWPDGGVNSLDATALVMHVATTAVRGAAPAAA